MRSEVLALTYDLGGCSPLFGAGDRFVRGCMPFWRKHLFSSHSLILRSEPKNSEYAKVSTSIVIGADAWTYLHTGTRASNNICIHVIYIL